MEKIDAIVAEMRSDKASVELLVRYINERIASIYPLIAKPLITEREADTLRGRVKELKTLLEAVQTGGEQV